MYRTDEELTGCVLDEDRPEPLADEQPLDPERKKNGAVLEMLDGRGNRYPDSLRVQQVGLRIAKAVSCRIDQALAGGPIRLQTVSIADSGKAHFKNYLLSQLLPELYADPLAGKCVPAKQIVSRKALRLLEDRANEAFCPPTGILELPGLTLTTDDLFDLMILVNEELFRDDKKF